MNEYDIREVSGVVSSLSDHRIVLKESATFVVVEPSTFQAMHLTPSSARRLARQLHRMATRVENRMAFDAAMKSLKGKAE